jgi:hypothetical protein
MNSLPIFFVGELNPQAAQLIEEFKKNTYIVIHSSIIDEIDQAGKQATKCVLIFTDFKFAVEYLKSGRDSWSGFKMVKILFLPAEPKVSPEIEKILYTHSLVIHHAKNLTSLFDKIKSFDQEKVTGPEDMQNIELEFTVNMEKK